MAKLTSDDLLKAIEEMSVLELKEFLDAFEEKFDVTAAAPVAVAAPSGGGEEASGGEEKDSFDVVLASAGDQKIQVINTIKFHLMEVLTSMAILLNIYISILFTLLLVHVRMN